MAHWTFAHLYNFATHISLLFSSFLCSNGNECVFCFGVLLSQTVGSSKYAYFLFIKYWAGSIIFVHSFKKKKHSLLHNIIDHMIDVHLCANKVALCSKFTNIYLFLFKDRTSYTSYLLYKLSSKSTY